MSSPASGYTRLDETRPFTDYFCCPPVVLSACRYQYRRCAPVIFNRRPARAVARSLRRLASGSCSVLKVKVNCCLRRAPPSESRPGLSVWGFGVVGWGWCSLLGRAPEAIRVLPVGATGGGSRCWWGWVFAGCAHRQNPDRASPARPRREHHPRPGLCALRSAVKSRIGLRFYAARWWSGWWRRTWCSEQSKRRLRMTVAPPSWYAVS